MVRTVRVQVRLRVPRVPQRGQGAFWGAQRTGINLGVGASGLMLASWVRRIGGQTSITQDASPNSQGQNRLRRVQDWWRSARRLDICRRFLPGWIADRTAVWLQMAAGGTAVGATTCFSYVGFLFRYCSYPVFGQGGALKIFDAVCHLLGLIDPTFRTSRPHYPRIP